MKEKEFEEELKEMDFTDGLLIEVYWTIDENDNVIIDTESMEEEFEMKMRELEGIIE